MTDRTDDSIQLQPGPTRRAFLGAGALTLLGLAAPTVRPAAAQTPKRGGTLVVAADVSPPGLDPQKSAAAHSWMISEHVYSNLLRRDPKMNIVGDLAESWQVVNDTTFVFKLRKGVVWHHGRDLVADDVKYSFERMLDEKTASPWRSNWSIIDRIEAPDRSTVRFVIKRPFAPFFSYLATPHYAAIVPRDIVEKNGDLQKTASGTGPFVLERFVPDNTVVLKRNPSYYEPGLPYLDGHRVPDHPGRGGPPGRAAGGHRSLPLVRRPAHRPAAPGRRRHRAPRARRVLRPARHGVQPDEAPLHRRGASGGRSARASTGARSSPASCAAAAPSRRRSRRAMRRSATAATTRASRTTPTTPPWRGACSPRRASPMASTPPSRCRPASPRPSGRARS